MSADRTRGPVKAYRPRPNVTVELTPEHAHLVMCALRAAATAGDQRIADGECTGGFGQCGQLRWIATFIEHKIRDAG